MRCQQQGHWLIRTSKIAIMVSMILLPTKCLGALTRCLNLSRLMMTASLLCKLPAPSLGLHACRRSPFECTPQSYCPSHCNGNCKHASSLSFIALGSCSTSRASVLCFAQSQIMLVWTLHDGLCSPSQSLHRTAGLMHYPCANFWTPDAAACTDRCDAACIQRVDEACLGCSSIACRDCATAVGSRLTAARMCPGMLVA